MNVMRASLQVKRQAMETGTVLRAATSNTAPRDLIGTWSLGDVTGQPFLRVTSVDRPPPQRGREAAIF
ncbi:MAG: hypothetical protein M3Q71_08570 [Chloroflexota bacterium]|nr:hypothetical protein [Chloroflexota bacterium]MDP9470709.1 hypothetical protein [Chloroflexota bacterium]